MKLSVLLFLIAALQVFAGNSYSQTARVSLSMKDATVGQVLDKIESQSEFYFLYNHQLVDINRKVNINAPDAQIKNILTGLFKGTDVKTLVLGRQIILSPKKILRKEISKNLLAQQQGITVTGTVTDNQGKSLPGVNIVIKGTTTGTITDAEGKYTLNVADPNATLMFSFVGYASQEIPVTGRGTVNVSMAEEVVGLEEVVAIGYGTVKKSDLTGSVAALKEDDFNKGVISSPDQLIKGKIAGVQVVESNSEPGGGISVRIRGANSINASNEPLYVIDGLPINNSPAISGTGLPGEVYVGTRTPSNPLSSLDPNNIESIEVLKDASAAAIYGARGSNGVILITTKKGQKGKFKIDYNSYIGIQSVAHKFNLLSPEDYKRVLNDILADGGGNPGEDVGDIQNGGTDWQDELFRNAIVTNHVLSFTGGSDNTQYYASLNYYQQDGIVISSGFKRYSASISLDQEISQKFHLSLNINPSYSLTDYVPNGTGINFASGALYAAYNFDPTLSIKDESGKYTLSPFISIDNPLAIAYGKNSFANNYRLLGTVSGEYFILPSLSVKLNLGTDANISRRDTYVSRITKNGAANQGAASIITGTNGNYLVEGTINYSKNFNNKHNINALVGITTQKFISKDFSGTGRTFPSDATETNNMGLADQTLFTLSSYKATSTLLSYIGRVNYSLLDKYLLTATIRADGSSKFGENNKFGYFPSVALAWKMNEENFIKDMGIFSTLKFRASWGETGNQEIGNYNSITTFTGGPSVIYNELPVATMQPARIENPNLKWETTEQLDIGLDFGFFKNRIYGNIDYFNKNTYNMLLQLPVPSSTGFQSKLTNIGKMNNTGFEVLLNTRNTVGEFKWNSNINFSTLKNKVKDIGGLPEIFMGGISWVTDMSIIKPGLPLNSFYGYKVVGVWQQNDDFGQTKDNVQPGDLKFLDVNKDSTVNADDRVVLGNSFPSFSWGFGNTFSYKNLVLYVFFEGVQSIKMLNANLTDCYYPINFRRNKFAEPYLHRWTFENPTNEYPSFVNPMGQGTKYVNTKTVQDASYIRLKTVRLSFKVPVRNNAFIRTANIYITGQNLLTFTKYMGLDPGVNANGNANLRMDYNAYPLAKSYIFGVMIGF